MILYHGPPLTYPRFNYPRNDFVFVYTFIRTRRSIFKTLKTVINIGYFFRVFLFCLQHVVTTNRSKTLVEGVRVNPRLGFRVGRVVDVDFPEKINRFNNSFQRVKVQVGQTLSMCPETLKLKLDFGGDGRKFIISSDIPP